MNHSVDTFPPLIIDRGIHSRALGCHKINELTCALGRRLSCVPTAVQLHHLPDGHSVTTRSAPFPASRHALSIVNQFKTT
jgi:hypothetical protein